MIRNTSPSNNTDEKKKVKKERRLQADAKKQISQ